MRAIKNKRLLELQSTTKVGVATAFVFGNVTLQLERGARFWSAVQGGRSVTWRLKQPNRRRFCHALVWHDCYDNLYCSVVTIVATNR